MSSPDEPFLPVCVPQLDGNEERYVLEALRGGWISSSGPQVPAFEERFAACCGRAHGVAVSSGTAALHVALRALDVGPGDEVILPDFTMAAALFAVLYCGARPVPVDAERRTWNLDPERVAAALTPRTKVVLTTHIYGHPCDVDAIGAIAERAGVAVVEDAAEAHGALHRGRPCGSFGRLSVFSFFANKIVTTGEGGMVLTDDPALADRCRSLRNLGFPRVGARDYWHDEVGFNYRFTALQAALGLAQLERLGELSEARRRNAARYSEHLRDVPGVGVPVEEPWVRNVYWMYGITIDPEAFGVDRDALQARLGARRIDTRPFFRPMHLQATFRAAVPDAAADCPVSVELAERGLYLPSSSGLTHAEIDRVCEAIRSVQVGGGTSVTPGARERVVFGTAYASLYDALYRDKRYDAECRYLRRVLAETSDRPVRTLLDLGCGTGGHDLLLARSGYRVTGVDRSTGMLRALQAKAAASGVDIETHRADLRTVRTGRRYDAVLSLFAVIGYQTTNDDLRRAFETARAHLRPGAPFLFDVWFGPAVLADPPRSRTKRVHAEGGGWIERRTRCRLDLAAQCVDVDFTTRRVGPGSAAVGAPAVREVHRMRFFFPQELALLLEGAGLALDRLLPFGRLRGTPDARTWNVLAVARRRDR